jgi:hypothetical protein
MFFVQQNAAQPRVFPRGDNQPKHATILVASGLCAVLPRCATVCPPCEKPGIEGSRKSVALSFTERTGDVSAIAHLFSYFQTSARFTYFNRQDHGRITLHSSQCPPLPVAPVRPPSCLGASVPVGLGALWLLAPTRPSCPASHRRTTPSLHAFVTCVAPRVAHEMQRSGQPGVGLRAMLALEHTLRMRYVIHAFRCRKEVHQTLLCIVRQ